MALHCFVGLLQVDPTIPNKAKFKRRVRDWAEKLGVRAMFRALVAGRLVDGSLPETSAVAANRSSWPD